MTRTRSASHPAGEVSPADAAAANAASRITFVISSLVAGGAERVLVTMADWWIDRGRQVTVIDFAPPDEQPFYPLRPGVREIRLGLRRTSHDPVTALVRNLRRMRRVRTAVRASRPDVVISFMDTTNVIVLLATLGLRVPVIVEEHSDPSQASVGWIWASLRALAYRRAAAVVALTPTALAYFPASIRGRGRVIPNPIVVDGPARPATGGRPDRGRIVAMGRLGTEKGFDLLLEAFVHIADEHPGWSLDIWGEGPERPRLEGLRDSLGLAGRVRLPGLTATPADVMRAADLFVLPSRQEGFGNVLAEAMALGSAVVAFDCPSGPREIIKDGHDGLLVPPEDVAGLAAAISRLIADPSERERLAHNAVAARQRFGVDTIMASWERLISEVRGRSVGS